MQTALEQRGLACFRDADDIHISERWAELIEAKLRSCTHFVILLSARSVLSEFVLAELRRVRRRDDFGAIPIGVGFADSIPYEFATYLDTDSIAPDFHHSTGTELGRRDIGGNAGRICEQSVITRGAAASSPHYRGRVAYIDLSSQSGQQDGV